MRENYYTVKQCAEHEIVIQKSRFIGNAFPVTCEEESLERIDEIRDKFPDASHHCYAYITGRDSIVQRFSDDGEPGGTAGMPMLQVIHNRELKDVLVVVTRYFGGTKLGAGGLVRAYSKTTTEVLNKAGTARMILSSKGIICFDYTHMGSVEYFLRQKGVRLLYVEYEDKVTMTVITPIEWEEFCGYLRELCSGRIECRELEPVFCAWESP